MPEAFGKLPALMETVHHRPPLPAGPRPIYIIGAGSIVRDAHLPAYRIAGFPVAGITNRTRRTAEDLAAEFGIERVYETVEEMVAAAPPRCVFDLTLPADLFVEALRKLPDGAAVLIQKPMGETMDDARGILEVCRAKRLVAAVNLQLRFAPYVVQAKRWIDDGVIGELRDIEVRVTTHTPWDHFAFLKNVKRLEILYHSVHHIDLVRHFVGEPQGVYAKTLRHPELPMPESRSSIIMDYGDVVRATIQTNHFHNFGRRHQESYAKWEGTHGAIKASMGLLLNYPHGEPDVLEIYRGEPGSGTWETVDVEGTWFPHAFIGSMAQVMRRADGDDAPMVTDVEDVIHTMACVEAAYASSRLGGVWPGQFLAGASSESVFRAPAPDGLKTPVES